MYFVGRNSELGSSCTMMWNKSAIQQYSFNMLSWLNTCTVNFTLFCNIRGWMVNIYFIVKYLICFMTARNFTFVFDLYITTSMYSSYCLEKFLYCTIWFLFCIAQQHNFSIMFAFYKNSASFLLSKHSI